MLWSMFRWHLNRWGPRLVRSGSSALAVALSRLWRGIALNWLAIQAMRLNRFVSRLIPYCHQQEIQRQVFLH